LPARADPPIISSSANNTAPTEAVLLAMIQTFSFSGDRAGIPL
jgi:hypothetical protein